MENKFCMSCGQQLDAGAKFCPYCGATQPTEAPNTQAQGGNSQPVGQPQQPQTPPVQPNPNTQQGYQQVPQQPGMQYQQQGQYQQNRVVKDFKKYKNDVPGQAGPQPKLGFIDSIKYIAVNTFDFKTPETRKSVYWWGVLGGTIITTILVIIQNLLAVLALASYSEFLALVTWFVVIVFYAFDLAYGISILAAMVRRTRYITNNPWLVLVPFYNLYLMLVDYPQYNPNMYQQYQQPYQQQNMNQAPNQMPQQPLQQQAPQQPVQPQNNDQNTPQN